jgi:hypothetical protein
VEQGPCGPAASIPWTGLALSIGAPRQRRQDRSLALRLRAPVDVHLDGHLVWMSSPITPTDVSVVARPFPEQPLARPMRLPQWLVVAIGVALATGPLAGIASRRLSLPRRILRTLLVGSGLAYAVEVALDSAEHFRLERAVTGHWLRWQAVPLTESAIHTAILATNVSVLLLARPPRHPLGVRDLWVLVAPAVFLGLGWADELRYHRRRATHRENVIHTTEHLAEGVMWAALYASRLPRWRRA